MIITLQKVYNEETILLFRIGKLIAINVQIKIGTMLKVKIMLNTMTIPSNGFVIFYVIFHLGISAYTWV